MTLMHLDGGAFRPRIVIALGIALGITALSGCGTKDTGSVVGDKAPAGRPIPPPSASVANKATTQTDNAPIVDPGDIPSDIPRGPDWAICFGKAARMLGKTKGEFVKEVGIPGEMDASTYTYRVFKDADNSASYISASFEGERLVGVVGKIRTVTDMKLDEVWSDLGADPLGPEGVNYYDDVTQYWQSHDTAPISDGNHFFQLSIFGKLSPNCRLLMTNLLYVQPPIMAKRTVNTKTNSVELSSYEANPLFSWKQADCRHGTMLQLWTQNPSGSPTEPRTITWKLR